MLLSHVLLFFLFGTFVVAVPARLKSSIRPLGNGPIPVPTRQPRRDLRIDGYWVRKILEVSLTSIQQSLNVFLLMSQTTPEDRRDDVLCISDGRVQLYRLTNTLGVLTLVTSRLTTRRQLSRLADLWTRMPTVSGLVQFNNIRASHLLQADTPAGYRNLLLHIEVSTTDVEVTMTLVVLDTTVRQRWESFTVVPPGVIE
jgi:hypothetical protein